jgi:hypothetical protein
MDINKDELQLKKQARNGNLHKMKTENQNTRDE